MADSARTGDYAERALAIARELGDPGIEAQATLRLGATLFRHGEYRQAIDLLGRAVPGLREHPLEHLHGESGLLACLCFLARALIEVGEFVPAMDRAKEAIQLGEAADAAFGIVHGHFALGLAHLRKGDLEHAVPTLERGLGIARARSVSFLEPLLCSAVGSAYAESGRIAEGISLLELGLGEAARMGHKGFVMNLRGWLAAGYLLAERQTDAATLALESLEAARQVGMTPREADARSMLGHIAASAQPPQIEEAEAHYRAALVLADALGMRPLVAHCHLGLAKLDRRTGKRRVCTEALHDRSDDVPRDGHAVLAGTGGIGDERVRVDRELQMTDNESMSSTTRKRRPGTGLNRRDQHSAWRTPALNRPRTRRALEPIPRAGAYSP